MKSTNIANFKKNLSAYLAEVEKGETVEIQRRNVPIARVKAIPQETKNHTVLGCGEGSVVFKGSITEPLIPVDSWEMLEDDEVSGARLAGYMRRAMGGLSTG